MVDESFLFSCYCRCLAVNGVTAGYSNADGFVSSDRSTLGSELHEESSTVQLEICYPRLQHFSNRGLRRSGFWRKTLIRGFSLPTTLTIQFFQFFRNGYSYKFTWKCIDNIKPGEEFTSMLGIHEVWWWGIMLRLAEFLETIFFVLRKKQNQITFLHLYHHISTIAIFWVFLKYSGSEFTVAQPFAYSTLLIHFSQV